MADERGWFRRTLVRVINDDNLDLYLLGTVALVFTVLGATGISDVKTLSSVVLALLALLAFSQIRSRRLTEQIRHAQRGSATALFASDFPADLMPRRARARELLLVGFSMTRTVQGMRSNLVAILEAGGRIRVLVLDPADEALMVVADRRAAHAYGPDKLRARITTTLDDLIALRERTGGQLEVRVSSVMPSAGFNCVDPTSVNGLVCVQHREARPDVKRHRCSRSNRRTGRGIDTSSPRRSGCGTRAPTGRCHRRRLRNAGGDRCSSTTSATTWTPRSTGPRTCSSPASPETCW